MSLPEDDLGDVKYLFNSEVSLLLSELNEKRGRTETSEISNVLKHCSRVSKFHSLDMIVHIRKMLETIGISGFEMTQIVNLCPETAEEAQTLIPTLGNKINPENLQDLLDQLSNTRRFQT
jgi:DNA-directed RNA polymerase II subunit RPB4